MTGSIWLGIDCGKTGGIGAIYSDGRVEAWHTPSITTRTKSPRAKTKAGKPRVKTETVYDLMGMLRLLQVFRKLHNDGWRVQVAIERQQQQQRDSKQVVFQVGRGQGLWEMACAANKLPFDLVMPSVWKPNYVPPGSNKAASREVCQKIYPGLLLPLAKDEAKAEAVLLADFIRRREQSLPMERTR